MESFARYPPSASVSSAAPSPTVTTGASSCFAPKSSPDYWHSVSPFWIIPAGSNPGIFTRSHSSMPRSGSFDGPARQALFPNLVPRSALPNAVALNSLLWKGSALLGPFLAGVAISWMGTAGAFYANAASYVAVVVAIWMMRVTSKGSSRRRSLLSETTEGFSYIVSRPVVLGVMVMEAIASIFGLNHTVLTIFASDILRVGAHGFGLLQSARGLGAVIGSSFYIGVGQQPVSRQNSFRLGDFLWRSFCPLRYFAGVPVVAFTHGFCRRDRHHLGRIPRHDSSDDYTRHISRPGDGSFSIEQPRAPSSGTSSIWPTYSHSRGAGGHRRRRACGISSNFLHRLESAGDLAFSLGRQIRGNPFRQEYCGVKTTACDSDWRFADQFELLLRGPW